MACELAIVEVIAEPGSDGRLTRVRVVGTAVDCPELEVTIECHGTPATVRATPRVSGAWLADFDLAALGGTNCECGGNVSVTARCTAQPSCEASFAARLQCCPEISRLQAHVGDGCAPGAGVRVVFDAFVRRGGSGAEVEWNFGDGNLQVTTPPGGPAIITTDHVYTSPGTFGATVVVRRGPCRNTTRSVQVVIPPCCPDLTTIEVGKDGCTVTLIAKLDSAQPSGVFRWDFGDGTVVEGRTPISPAHTYRGRRRATATVTFVADGPCEPRSRSTTIELEGCDQPGGGDGSSGCAWFGLAIAVAFATMFAVALLVLLMNQCLRIPVPGWLLAVAAGAAIVGVFLLGLWRAVCDEDCPCPGTCDLLQIGWTSLVAAGLLGFYLWRCCSSLWNIAAVGFFVAGVGLSLAWQRRCNINDCRVLSTWSIVVTLMAAEVFALVHLLPLVEACASRGAAVAIGAFAVVLAVAAGACKATE